MPVHVKCSTEENNKVHNKGLDGLMTNNATISQKLNINQLLMVASKANCEH